MKKQPVLVYIRLESRKAQETIKRVIKRYCQENNYKAIIISQIKSDRQRSQSYESAINSIFEENLVGLIYAGDGNDIEELKKIFQARNGAFIKNANEIKASSAKVEKTERVGTQDVGTSKIYRTGRLSLI